MEIGIVPGGVGSAARSRNDIFFSPKRPCPGITDPDAAPETFDVYKFDASFFIIVDTQELDRLDIKFYLSSAGAVVTSWHVPTSAIHSCIYMNGMEVFVGPRHPPVQA